MSSQPRARAEEAGSKGAVLGSGGGRVGARRVAELLARVHSVTGIEPRPNSTSSSALPIEVVRADATNAAELAPAIAGHDAVISATRFVRSCAKAVSAALEVADINRLLVVDTLESSV